MRTAQPESLVQSGPLSILYFNFNLEQFKQLEKKRKKCEAGLAVHFPRKRVTSTNNIPILRLQGNPSRVNRLIIDYWREHAHVITLIAKQQIASLQINHSDEVVKAVNFSVCSLAVKSGKKIGPVVPPKPKKFQPQILQIYTVKAPPMPLKLYQNDNLYACQPEEKFEPKYRYDEKNYYFNIGNIPAPQVPIDDRTSKASWNVVYSNNIEPPVLIPVTYKYPNKKNVRKCESK